ncbi:MAG: hypothetical protein E2O59_03920 [Gammaproteobacteria bacterium]|nr:MAG: hypothetical protein E2O59_03920 [Gammaproteobacteria bacterium]
MMKYILAIVIFVMTTSLNAETLSFPSFQIEIQDGWEHTIETGPGDNWGSVISLSHPNGVGSLKILPFDAPAVVSEDILRNLTNVEFSVLLTWKNWGDYSGYQYDYLERGSFYRQWWLTNERTILFITYQCDPESKDIETEEIDKLVRSIKTTPVLKRSESVDIRDYSRIRGE